jgi:hypothetical protein
MADFLIVALAGAAVFWLVGPQTKFSLHYSIYLAGLVAVSLLETETYTRCMWEGALGEGVMVCREITQLH